MDNFEKIQRKALGKHYNPAVHKLDGNNPEMYDRALKGEICQITKIENYRSNDAYVELKFEDGFECTTERRCLIKIEK